MAIIWNIPSSLLKNSILFIIGGGPTVLLEDLLSIQKFYKTYSAYTSILCINNSYLLFPYADYIYFSDKSWFFQHIELTSFIKHPALKITHNLDVYSYLNGSGSGSGSNRGNTHKNKFLEHNQDKIKFILQSKQKVGLCKEKNTISTGYNSGHGALNIAYHFKSKHIILLGYDMQYVNSYNNWHSNTDYPTHSREVPKSVYNELYIPAMNKIGEEINNDVNNLLVWNTSPNTSLDVFPKMNLHEVLNILNLEYKDKNKEEDKGKEGKEGK